MEILSRIGDADAGHDFNDPLHGLVFSLRLMQLDSLGDLVAYCVNWTEGGHGFLEDHADAGTSNVPHQGIIWSEIRYAYGFLPLLVVAVKKDLTLSDASWLGHDLQYGLRSNTLATAAFPYDSQGLTFGYGKAGSVDSLDYSLSKVEVGFQILYFQK